MLRDFNKLRDGVAFVAEVKWGEGKGLEWNFSTLCIYSTSGNRASRYGR